MWCDVNNVALIPRSISISENIRIESTRLKHIPLSLFIRFALLIFPFFGYSEQIFGARLSRDQRFLLTRRICAPCANSFRLVMPALCPTRNEIE